jgi:aspartate aminotransferase
MAKPYSQRIENTFRYLGPLFQSMQQAMAQRSAGDPELCDFSVGDPHEMAPASFSRALQQASVPQNIDWFAGYNMPSSQALSPVTQGLRERRHMDFQNEDVFLTNGAFSALAIAIDVLVDPGDEVIFNSPPWFFYEALIGVAGGTPVRVRVNPKTFDLDLDAIAAALTPQTRAVIVNTPNNPSGLIYPPATLERLARILDEASARNGRTIYIISDEAYSRILFDGNRFYSPTAFYPHTFLIYTYTKQTLAPGERLGYIALPPTMPEREALRMPIMMAEIIRGHTFPTSLLQHALPEIEKVSIDLAHLQAKRDRMVGALREMGYDVNNPEATFYLLVRSPLADEQAFCEQLAARKVLVLPGSAFELPGYFRVSLTANAGMIDRGLPHFEAAIRGSSND